jgi:LysM repeat protein
MFKENYTKPKVMITETRTYKLWESAGRKIVEAQLTPDQIKQIFQYAQNIETAGGTNRTMIGKGKDAASAVGQAWEELKTKAQNSKPIDGFEKKYDAIAQRLKQATGGDQGAMKYVQKYRDFAKKHPIAQGVIYAALIAAIGLSGAGVGGAAALGLFKMTDKLLQGDKFTSAAYSGVKTGGLAYGASQLAQYFQNPKAPLPDNIDSVKLPNGTDYVVKKGDTLSQIAQKYGVSVEELMKANNGATTVTPSGQSMTWNDPNALSDVNPMGDAVPPSTGVQQDYDVKTAPKVANPDRINVGQKLNIPGATGSSPYQGGVGTAADTWNKIGAGKYPYDQISANQAAKYGIDTGGLGDASKAGGKMASDAAGLSQADINQMRNQNLFRMQDQADAAYYADKPDDVGINPRNNDAVGTGMPGSAQDTPASNTVSGLTPEQRANPAFQEAYQKVMQQYADQPMRRGIRQKAIAAGKEALAALANSPVNESIQLSESQIFLLIGKIVERQRRIDEGIMDTLKGAAGKTANWARTKGQNLTTKITADKLLQAWKKAQSPTDSDAVAKVMINAGVPQETVTNLMKNFVQGPSAGTNTNVWQGADRSIPAIQRKQQGQSFAATPNNAQGQSTTQYSQASGLPHGINPEKVNAAQQAAGLPPVYKKTANGGWEETDQYKGSWKDAPMTGQWDQSSGQQTKDLSNPNQYKDSNFISNTTAPMRTGRQSSAAIAQANKGANPLGGEVSKEIDQIVDKIKTVRQDRRPKLAMYGKEKFDQLAQEVSPQTTQSTQEPAADNTIEMPKKRTRTRTKKVAEGEFAGNYATGIAGQWRNKGPKANKPATIGDLVGEGEETDITKKRVDNPPIKGTPNKAKTGYYPTPKPPVKKLDTPYTKESVAEGSEDLARILHIAGIKK